MTLLTPGNETATTDEVSTTLLVVAAPGADCAGTSDLGKMAGMSNLRLCRSRVSTFAPFALLVTCAFAGKPTRHNDESSHVVTRVRRAEGMILFISFDDSRMNFEEGLSLLPAA